VDSGQYHAYALTTQAPRERLGFFQAVVNQVFCPMHVQPHRTGWASFDGHIEAAALGSLGLAKVSTSPCLVRRRREDIARMSEAPYLVKFQLKGESFWMQRNREVHLRPGDFVIASTAEPYTLQFYDAYEMPVLALTGDTMRCLTRDPDQFLGVHMSGEEADCGLLSSFVAQVAARMSRLRGPMIPRIEANILNLLGGVLSARAHPSVVSMAEQLSQIKAYIREHLRDRRLGPTMVAEAFGISTRYVHKLFENQPMTLGRYIRSLRVQACRRMLEERPQPEASLTDVALAWGFYDLSHMSRCFREEFRLTPSEVRTLATL
jgi:AraC-like DNA-binding protein